MSSYETPRSSTTTETLPRRAEAGARAAALVTVAAWLLLAAAQVTAAPTCRVPLQGSCSGSACALVVTINGDQFIQLPDTDANDLCEWPAGQTSIGGPLVFGASAPIEFQGKTTIKANQLLVEEDGLLSAAPDTTAGSTFATRNLTLIALRQGLKVLGTLDIVVSDDLLLRAKRGDLELLGSTKLGAADRLTLDAHRGDLVVVAPPGKSGDILGRNRVDVLAQGQDGNVDLAGEVQIAGRRVTVSNRTNRSVFGAKELMVREGAVLTTDPARTGVTSSTPSDITLDATGPIVVRDRVEIASGRGMRIQSRRGFEQVCLQRDVTLAAAVSQPNTVGKIEFTNPAAPVLADDTVVFQGVVVGTVTQPAVCGPPPPPTTTTTAAPPSTTTTTTTTTIPAPMSPASWRFYVRTMTASGTLNVDVPRRSSNPPIEQEIKTSVLPVFRIGDQVTGGEIAAADPDTLALFLAVVEAHILANPADYPGFSSVVELRWAKRVGP